MTDTITIKSRVDTALIDRVEQECFQILYQQRVAYNTRWVTSRLLTRSLAFLRWAGLVLSLLGVFISVFYLLYPSTCPRWYLAELFLAFFIGAAVLFYYLARIEAWYLSMLKKAGRGGSKRMARRLVARARKAVPYVAEYNVKGDLITYYRGKEGGKGQQAWSKRIKGFAIVGETVTLLFRKPTSIVPTMLILYDNSEALESVLQRLAIPYEKQSATISER